MELKALYLYAAVLAPLLCSSVNFIQSPTDMSGGLLEPAPSSAGDFGAVVSDAPLAVLRSKSPADIALLLGALSSAAAAHSLQGQAQTCAGIVVETRPCQDAIMYSYGGRSQRPCYPGKCPGFVAPPQAGSTGGGSA